jgi:hypothetical protein
MFTLWTVDNTTIEVTRFPERGKPHGKCCICTAMVHRSPPGTVVPKGLPRVWLWEMISVVEHQEPPLHRARINFAQCVIGCASLHEHESPQPFRRETKHA